MKAGKIIQERHNTHGDYVITSKLSQCIKNEMHKSDGWKKLEYKQKESLEMIAVKISRILSGNPNIDDHWDDICGYAILGKNPSFFKGGEEAQSS